MFNFKANAAKKVLLNENNLKFIIRSHENVIDGFEKFANEKVITVFSNMNYMGKNLNASAVLIIKKNSEIVPKVIYPPQNLLSNARWMNKSPSDELAMINALELLKKGVEKFANVNGINLDQFQIKLKRKNPTPQRIKIMRKN